LGWRPPLRLRQEAPLPVTDSLTGTRIDEIAPRIYRVSVPIPPSPELPPGFSFNQFLIAADEPLLFHSGPRRLFPLVREAVATVLPPESLRYVGFSHVEGDESGALAEWLELAPRAEPVCSRVAAMVFTRDATDRSVRALADGESLDLGGHRVTWFDAPHVPHGWDCGFLGETTTLTLFCGDLFTQAGATNPPLTERDILGPSEGMRQMMDYFAHGKDTRRHLEKLAAFEPRVLACMHGSAFAGDGRAKLLELAGALEA
jgi:flavorubredoxin